MQKLRGPFGDARLFAHGGAAEPEAGPRLDFSVSLNPLGPPRSVLRAVRRALPAVARYPDTDCRLLVERLAALHGVDPAQVLVGNGSTDLIHRLPLALRPRRVAIVEPTFTEYLAASRTAGARIDHWLPTRRSFRPRPFDPGRADFLWVCNPNNPTGSLWPRGLLAEWIASFPRTRFVVDEAFLPFLAGEKYHTLVPAVERLPNLIVLRSLTKLFAFPGLRLGYAIVPGGEAGGLRSRMPCVPWSVNALAQVAALAALDEPAYLARTHAWLEGELPRFAGRLAGLAPDVEVIPSSANFLLLRLAKRTPTSGHVVQLLAERGIAVRDASNFVGLDERYIRVAVRSRRENDRFLQLLGSLLHAEG